ncbi:MAG: SpoIID/LytB domain-containing protein, partial [Oscillospiraceae bacterium]
PYLRSVASPYDTLAPGYESTKKISPEEIRKKMEQRWPDARYNFDLPYSDWFSELTYTLGATVVSVKICGFSITGVEARSVFGLKSATFTVEYQDDSFLFRTKGSGHGVGMSQTGAIYMAAEGADYQEILNWYYPGTELRL